MIGANLSQQRLELGLLLGKVGLFDQRDTKARAGEDHHTERVLEQVGACVRSQNQEEAVLDLLVQPTHTCQPAKAVVQAVFFDNC